MTRIAGATGRAVWKLNANGSRGTLSLSSSDNVALTGSVTFEDVVRGADPITGRWNETTGELRFTRRLPAGATQNFVGFLGDNHPDHPMVAGSFTQSDTPPGSQRQEFGWVAVPKRDPLDLVWDVLDSNGLPKNPRWAYQIESPWSVPNPKDVCVDISIDCTTQHPTTDTATICRLATGQVFGIAGHLNWFGATYEGPVFWTGKSWDGEDDDYNFNLIPPQGAGLTSASNGAIGLEFDSDDTIDHFRTPWWSRFHDAVDNDDKDARLMVDGHRAIVSGLFGLDCPHGANAELHPVWAMAILADDNPTEQLWAMFIMPWGNEGFCGSHEHRIDILDYTFDLPWVPNASSVEVMWDKTYFLTNSRQVTGPYVEFSINEGIRVTFTLPPPSTHPRLNGELRLRWRVAEAEKRRRASHISAKPIAQRRPATVFSSLTKGITPEQLELLKAGLNGTDPVGDDLVPNGPRKTRQVDRIGTSRRSTVNSVRDIDKERSVSAAFKAVLGWEIPEES